MRTQSVYSLPPQFVLLAVDLENGTFSALIVTRKETLRTVRSPRYGFSGPMISAQIRLPLRVTR